jgi:hypothetical protein
MYKAIIDEWLTAVLCGKHPGTKKEGPWAFVEKRKPD